MKIPHPLSASSRALSSVFLATGQAGGFTLGTVRLVHHFAVGFLPALLLFVTTREEVYNILWALVFGFATLNIVSLGARRFEPQKSGLNFGETLAILVVIVSLVLLGWEMLYLFHVLPIRLNPQ
jgi:hypothetical protein